MKNAGWNLTIVLLLVAGCDRQIPIIDTQNIAGYEVQGAVTDQVGNAIPNVSVHVDYDYDVIYKDSAVTRQYFVTNNSVLTQAVVVNWNNQVVRVLTPPLQYYGAFQAFWDGKDSTGAVPPSGIYYVEYLVGGKIAYSYNQLVSGGKVAATDAHGRYTIPIQYLPIDSSSVPFFRSYDSLYVGNTLITNNVIFTFVYQTHTLQLLRTVNKDQVTFIDVSF
jgi:hypothetical protein